MTRTDVHRPSAINPSEYDYVGFSFRPRSGDILADVADTLGDREAIRQHMTCTGGRYSGHEHGGSCHVCGASAIYLVVFHHRHTNTYIQTGMDCADNMTMSYDVAAYNLFRRNVQQMREKRAGRGKAINFLTQQNLQGAWAIYNDENRPAKYEENTITDMVDKLVRYGSLSQNQVGFMQKLLAKIPARAGLEAARAVQAAAALDIPANIIDQRVLIRGEIVSIKEVEGNFGLQTKMLIVHADGWKLWGTMPSAARAQRGDKVSFTAKVQKSNNDPKFGFFSRPTGFEVFETFAPQVTL